MAKTDKHENVSIYPFTDEEIDLLMENAGECVLMWSTKDGWPVGVTHAFIWHEGKIWVTFTAQRHRASAIRRDNRVSVNVSSCSYPAADSNLPEGAITFKGHGDFFEDDASKDWFYNALAHKWYPDNPEFVVNLLDSPLRIMLCVTPEKKIMYNKGVADAHLAGTAEESRLGQPLESDAERYQRELEKRGFSN